ncbi:hypothetical protein OBBRIDRAFT_252041 [Obba rivulosa]|uniref:Uncharacterized protein n=1 Tax=Obba rivulosa TaxID=1052685 RepID=A0A8E2DQH6_9APHY|nr:hypothetical protein OBBRIDRAFT_252041 [Obba rivulosa]
MFVKPLPEKNPFDATLQHVKVNAYRRCRDFEARGSMVPPKTGVTEQIAARILGYTLVYAPSTEGRAMLASRTNDCETDDELRAPGNMYKDFMLRC